MSNHKQLQFNIEIKVNTFNTASALKARIKDKYLVKYKNMLHIDQKKILPPSEDRLSQLTTRQIDRIIQMQKIKQLLNEKKGRCQTVSIDKKNYKKHMNIYQSNFLAKINRIAMNRNIRHLRSQQFDQNEAQNKQLKRQRQLAKQKQTITYNKIYRNKQIKKIINQDDDIKSIDSIPSDIQQFQKTIQFRKTYKSSFDSYQNKRKGNLDNRWFQGMSKIYLLSSNKQVKQEIYRGFDIQYKNIKQKKQKIRIKTIY